MGRYPFPLNINYNLLHTSTLIHVSVSISVSAPKASAIRIIGIVNTAAAAEVTTVQLGNSKYPPPIFDTTIPDYDITGTYIVTINTTNGDHILQL